MKRQRDIGAYYSRKGAFEMDVPEGQIRGLVITDGASVQLITEESHSVLASGRGEFTLDVVSDFPGRLVFVPDSDEVITSVHLNGWGPVDKPAGFLGTESFVQLDAKSRNSVAPEVQQMFDMMQRNALRREAVLRAELEKVRGR